jgi:predicted HicB family RNase H-like nuclease
MIKYKGHFGTFEFNTETKLFQGRISNINDLITFQGKSLKEIEQAFQEAVDEYIQWCAKYRNSKKKGSLEEEKAS